MSMELYATTSWSGTQNNQGVDSLDESIPSANLLRWIATFPADSLRRLRSINEASTTSRHIILSLSYGLFDPHIKSINRMIIQLMLTRMKSERSGDNDRVARIEASLEALHEAIDAATGVSIRSPNSGQLCKAPARN